MTAIGDALAAARGSRSIVAVARATQISHTTLSRYEGGLRLPGVVTLYRLVTYYGLDWPWCIELLAQDHAAVVRASALKIVPQEYQSHGEERPQE